MYKKHFLCFIMLVFMLQCYADKRGFSDIPTSHIKIVNSTLKLYQREFNKLVRNSDSTKSVGLVKVFFDKDTNVVKLNHIVPKAFKPALDLESIFQKSYVKPSEYFKLIQKIYKGNIMLELDRDEMIITSVDSTIVEDASNYRVQIPISIVGKIGELNIEKEDTLNIFIRVLHDSKMKVKFAKITHLLDQEDLYPPIIESLTPMIDWNIEKKIKTVLDKLTSIDSTHNEEKLMVIAEEMKVFLTPSAFFKIEDKKGNIKQYNLIGLLHFLQKNPSKLLLKTSTLNLFDSFRLQTNKKWYCRTTTYHDVSRFNENAPVPAKVTSVQRVLMPQQAPTQKDSYWMIYSLHFLLED